MDLFKFFLNFTLSPFQLDCFLEFLLTCAFFILFLNFFFKISDKIGLRSLNFVRSSSTSTLWSKKNATPSANLESSAVKKKGLEEADDGLLVGMFNLTIYVPLIGNLKTQFLIVFSGRLQNGEVDQYTIYLFMISQSTIILSRCPTTY